MFNKIKNVGKTVLNAARNQAKKNQLSNALAAGAAAGAATGAKAVSQPKPARPTPLPVTPQLQPARTLPQLPAIPRYPTAPASLTAAEIEALNARRRQASRVASDTLAQTAAERARLNADREFGLAEIARMAQTASRDARQTAGGRGLAWSPGGLGRDLVHIRDEAGRARGELTRQITQRLAELAALDQRVIRTRDEELAAVAADEARRRAMLNKLIQGVR